MSAPQIINPATIANEKGVQLINGQFARPVTFPSGITRARIGVRLLTSTQTSLVSTPRLAIGMCKGTTNIFGDVSVDEFVGVVSNSATWTWNSGNYAFNFQFAPAWLNGSGTVNTGTNFTTVVWATWNYAPNNLPNAFYVDIEVTGTNTQAIRLTQPSAFAANCSSATFLTQMANVVPSIANHTQYGPISASASTTNFWDNRSINISWDREDLEIDVLDVAVACLI